MSSCRLNDVREGVMFSLFSCKNNPFSYAILLPQSSMRSHDHAYSIIYGVDQWKTADLSLNICVISVSIWYRWFKSHFFRATKVGTIPVKAIVLKILQYIFGCSGGEDGFAEWHKLDAEIHPTWVSDNAFPAFIPAIHEKQHLTIPEEYLERWATSSAALI